MIVQHRQVRLRWDRTTSVDDWGIMMFSEESRICIDASDDKRKICLEVAK